MKKTILLLLLLLPLTKMLHAQNVGINNPAPAASALLDLTATNKGLLIPRMTTVQRNAISTPATGLLVFDITLNRFYYYDGVIWRPLLDNLIGWYTFGNAGTNPANNFLGTTDNQPLKIRVNNITAGSIQTDAQTFLGLNCGLAATGTFNTAYGGSAFRSNIGGGSFNSAFGYEALKNNNSGSQNCAFGIYSLQQNTSGTDNCAMGNFALSSNTTGGTNIAIGAQCMTGNTTGSGNVAMGYAAGAANTTGSDNVCIGYGCTGGTTANANTGVGYAAMPGIATSSENTAIGGSALYTQSFSNGGTAWHSDNVAIGMNSLYFNQPTSTNNGIKNTATGHSSLKWNTTGFSNTGVGWNAGFFNQAGSFNTYVGAVTGTSIGSPNNATSLGYGAGNVLSASNRIEIGNTSVSWIGGQVNWATYSDGRIKDNVQHDVVGLDFINKLNPVTYNYNTHRTNEMIGSKDTSVWKEKYDIENIRFSGFIAQQVEQAAADAGYNFSGVCKPQNANDLYSIRYAEFVVPLVKSVQELSVQNEKLKTEATVMKNTIDVLLLRIEKLEKQK